MKLDVRHRTRYDYANPAAFSQHLLRVTPCTSPGQRVILTGLTIEPEPDEIGHHRDMFGNLVHVATVTRPHTSLEIVATSNVERATPNDIILSASVPWERARASALGLDGVATNAAIAPFAFPSQMTQPDADIVTYGEKSLQAGRPVLDAARELTTRIFTDFAYDTAATGAETLPDESFRLKKGVCQDFAHVMLAALRAQRIPARYVSGYLRTIPPEGKPRLQGADASHAWVSVWDPALGWIDFDPTNDCIPGQDHVTLAYGRDYSDVSPVSGIVIGAGRQALSVGVDVLPVEDSERV